MLCSQVVEVIKDEVGVVSEWKVRWWSTSDGPQAGTELATFHYLPGPNYLEVIAVDSEVLVASADRLVGGNKKLPAATVKEAKRVLQSALNAFDNGEVLCRGCQKEEPGHKLVQCGCCPVVYHESCAPGYSAHDTEPWWCPDCTKGVSSDDDS